MKMNRMVLWGYNTSVLQNKLNRGVVCQPIDLCPIVGLQVLRSGTREVESDGWVGRKISSVNPTDVEEMSLKKCHGGHDETDVVDAGHDSASVACFACRARVDPQPDCEKQVVVDLQRDLRRKLLGVQALEGVDETVGDLGGVNERRFGDSRRGAGEGAGVMKSGGGSYVVDSNGRVHERRGGDQVLAGVLIGGDEGIGSLARSYKNSVDLEWLYVGGINFDNGELVAGNLEEKLFIERSVDYSQQIGLSVFNR